VLLSAVTEGSRKS